MSDGNINVQCASSTRNWKSRQLYFYNIFDLCDIDNHYGKGVYMYIYIYAALIECSAVVQLG